MKVIGINGSPRLQGNTELLLQEVYKELNRRGIETETISLAQHPVKGCVACRACIERQNKRCIMEDDAFNECLEKIIAADGVILASPVYSAGVTSQMKAFIDRASIVLAANRGLLRHKAGAALVAARRGGAVSAFDTLNHFLHSKEMFLVGSTYWNMGYGNAVGEVAEDQEGMANMANLGENMAWLLQKIHA